MGDQDKEIANLCYMIKNYKNRFREVKEAYDKTLDRFAEAEEEKKEILWRVQEMAEKIVTL